MDANVKKFMRLQIMRDCGCVAARTWATVMTV